MADVQELLLTELRSVRTELTELRVDVAHLEERVEALAPNRGRQLVRDGGLTISGATLGAIIAAVAQVWLKK